MAKSRFGRLGATVMPMRPTPSASNVGRPLPAGRHVSPPSVDLNTPLPGPLNSPFSHGPCRASHSTAYTVRALVGSNAMSMPPVFSSL